MDSPKPANKHGWEDEIRSAAAAASGNLEGRNSIWANREQIYDTILTALSSYLRTSYIDVQKLQKLSRGMLQMEQILHTNWKGDNRVTTDLSKRIWGVSIRVLTNDKFPTDSSLLIASAFSFFINSNWETDKVGRVVLTILKYFEENPNISALDMELVTTFHPIVSNLDSAKHFPSLLLIHGFLNSGQKECLLKIGYCKPLVMELFPHVISLCRTKQFYQFHAFQLLLSWLQFVDAKLQEICNAISKESACEQLLFAHNSNIVCSLLEIFDSNWENPITGVTELLRKSFTLLISIANRWESFDTRSNCGDLVKMLMCRTLQLPNSSKGKYFTLAALIPHFGGCKFMAICENFPSDLVSSLTANHLASAGCDVYRILLSAFRKEVEGGELVMIWARKWLAPVLCTLSHTDRIVQQNSVRYWLPTTLQQLPESYKLIYSSADDIGTKVILMKVARKIGLITYDELDIAVIETALFVHSDAVRSEAFAVLCNTHKKAEPVSGEIALIKRFLALNLNIYNSAFRQQLSMNIQYLVIRIRDSCSTMLSVVQRQPTCSPILEESIDFVDWLWKILLENLMPGTCYQRRQTCLELAKIILDSFVARDDKKRHKGAVPVRTTVLMEYAKSLNKWKFHSSKARSVFLFCLMDYMSEIKDCACSLLEEYFVSADISIADFDTMFELGFQLCNSPKAFLAESGSLILKYYFGQLQLSCRNSFIDGPESFVHSIATKLKAQFEIAKLNILESARSAPMHGLVLTLQRILCESKKQPFWTLVHCADKINQLLEEIITLVRDIVYFCLNALAMTTSELDVSPSFAEMGQAIEEVVKSNKSSQNDAREDPIISLDHEFVLACYWLNLKHCSHLMGNMVACLPLQTNTSKGDCDIFIAKSYVETVGKVLVSVMQKTRHRGAIEACGEALKLYCRRLFQDPDPQLHEIPLQILECALHDVVATATATSVTRRSAGLAILAQAVISSETKIRQRKLLETTLNRLLDIANLPVGDCTDECTDLPQSHSLHILRAFVHDANLTQDIYPYLDDVMMTCLHAFTSPAWALRNAALQLFGAVLPKLFGQKKFSEDVAYKDMLTAKEFFGRYPQLANFLRTHLTEVVNSQTVPHSTIIPIFAILGRLSPQSIYDDNLLSDNLKQFAYCLKQFLSSPIWYVRKMAAVAFGAVTDLNMVCGACEDLLESLSKEKSCSYNQIHGHVIAVRNLLKHVPKPDDTTIEKLKMKLSNCMWLLGKENRCSIVKMATWKMMLNLPSWIEIPLEHIAEDLLSPTKCLWMPGEREYSGLIARWMLRKCTADKFPGLVLQLLKSDSGQDCKNSCLKFLRNNLENDNYDWTEVQNALVHAVIEESLPSVLHSILEIIVEIFLKKNVAGALLQDGNVKMVVEKLATGQQFTLVSATALALWSIIIAVMTENQFCSGTKDENVVAWATLVRCRSTPDQSEIYRLHAAKSLHISGAVVLNTTARQTDIRMHGNEEIIVALFEAGMDLLQDENLEVRCEAACFVSSLNTVSQCVFHVNHAIWLFGEYLLKNFWSCIAVRNHLWGKIKDTPSTFDCIQSVLDSTLALFRQDDFNVYSEPCLMGTFYRNFLQHIVEAIEGGPHNEEFALWVDSAYKVTITDALKVLNFLEEIPGTKLFEIISHGKVPPLLSNLRNRLQLLTFAKPLMKEPIYEVISRLNHCHPHFKQSAGT